MGISRRGLEDHETLQQGLERELIEELGVKPDIGRLLNVQQLFTAKDYESLKFFFEVTNGYDYQNIDLETTTHGVLELSKVAFIDPNSEYMLPQFLKQLPIDLRTNIWPKVFVRTAEQA